MSYPTSRITTAVCGAALLLLGACTTKETPTPSLTGPSELSTSITITLSPDVVTQDGASQSLVTIVARDQNGNALRNQSLRVDIAVGGVLVDFGSLSARNVVTDANGRATVVFTAPPAAGAGVPATDVQIFVTPAGGDFANANPRSATIRVVPSGVIVPPRGSVTAAFSVTTGADNEPTIFNATQSASTTGTIVQWLWNFGDGTTGSGEIVQHNYRTAGSFPVTLTVVDSIGATNSTTQTVTIGQGALPTAVILTSPTNPVINQAVNFNASTSRPAPGRTIRSFEWDFGDGSRGTGATTTHAYSDTGTFTVVLTVTDDVGRFSTATTTITVGQGTPTADFTFNPSAPRSGQDVTFDGSPSRAASGRTIVSYSWAFGDGGSGSGQTVVHRFPTVTTPTTFNVLLTVTDSAGQTNSVTKPVTVTPF